MSFCVYPFCKRDVSDTGETSLFDCVIPVDKFRKIEERLSELCHVVKLEVDVYHTGNMRLEVTRDNGRKAYYLNEEDDYRYDLTKELLISSSSWKKDVPEFRFPLQQNYVTEHNLINSYQLGKCDIRCISASAGDSYSSDMTHNHYIQIITSNLSETYDILENIF